MELWKEISLFLLDNKELSIEDFGSFEVINQEPSIDKTKKTVTPPDRKIVFKEKAAKTTDEFVSLLAKKYGLDSNKINEKIKSEVQKATEYLDKGEKLSLPGLGYFLKRTKNIEFITPDKYSISPEHFGLSEVKLPEKEQIITDVKDKKKTKKEAPGKKQVKVKEPKKKTPKTKPVKTKASKKSKSKPQTTPNQPVYNPVKKEKSSSKKILLWLSVAAILALLIAFYKPIYNQISKISKPGTVKIHTKTDTGTDQVTTKDTVEYAKQTPDNTPETDMAQNTGEDTAATTNAQNTNTENDESLLNEFSSKAKVSLGSGYKKYYLIVGSFTYIENARKLKTELQKTGYPAEILTSDIEKYRVTIGGFDDLKKAVDAYQNYIIKNPGKDAWLLINE